MIGYYSTRQRVIIKLTHPINDTYSKYNRKSRGVLTRICSYKLQKTTVDDVKKSKAQLMPRACYLGLSPLLFNPTDFLLTLDLKDKSGAISTPPSTL